MMLSFGEDGTLHKVDEEKTVLVDEEELDMLVNKVNEQSERIKELEKGSQDYENVVSKFFLENWNTFDRELKDEITLLFDIDGDADDYFE